MEIISIEGVQLLRYYRQFILFPREQRVMIINGVGTPRAGTAPRQPGARSPEPSIGHPNPRAKFLMVLSHGQSFLYRLVVVVVQFPARSPIP